MNLPSNKFKSPSDRTAILGTGLRGQPNIEEARNSQRHEKCKKRSFRKQMVIKRGMQTNRYVGREEEKTSRRACSIRNRRVGRGNLEGREE